jgi:hypothetical protein
MSDLNLKYITVAILTNKKKDNNQLNNNNNYTITLEPICITKETFKYAFYSSNFIAPNEFIEITNFKYYNKRLLKDNKKSKSKMVPLSLYDETLSIFMKYNNVLSENAINPKLLIDYTNDIFKYKNFKDIPITLSCMNWVNVLEWLNDNDKATSILCLRIEFHYYDPHFMPDYVKYVFCYYIC